MLNNVTANVVSKESKINLITLLLIQLLIAYEWLTASWSKIANADFIVDMNKTLAFFAGKNPFAWYKEFLLGPATQNSAMFARLVEYGELAVGLALAISALALLIWQKHNRLGSIMAIIGLIVGMFLSANFYFAAGWTGVATKSLNVILFWLQAILAGNWLIRMRK